MCIMYLYAVPRDLSDNVPESLVIKSGPRTLENTIMSLNNIKVPTDAAGRVLRFRENPMRRKRCTQTRKHIPPDRPSRRRPSSSPSAETRVTACNVTYNRVPRPPPGSTRSPRHGGRFGEHAAYIGENICAWAVSKAYTADLT